MSDDYGMQQGTQPPAPPSEAPREFELAGWGIRLGAYLIDYVILTAVNMVLVMLTMPVMMAGTMGMAEGGQPDPAQMSGLLAIQLGIWLGSMAIQVGYFAGFWAWKDGQTPGKMAVGIRVVSSDGSSIGLGQGILRYVGYLISGAICMLGFLWPLWDDENRAWHDMIASTRVVMK